MGGMANDPLKLRPEALCGTLSFVRSTSLPMPASRKESAPLVHLIDARTQGHYVLMPAAAYAVVAPLFEAQEPRLNETLAIVEPVVLAEGWLDPAMDAYDHYTAPSARPNA